MGIHDYIIRLIEKGYEVRFRPFSYPASLIIELRTDNYAVTEAIQYEFTNMTKEELIVYSLRHLEFQMDKYVERSGKNAEN